MKTFYCAPKWGYIGGLVVISASDIEKAREKMLFAVNMRRLNTYPNERCKEMIPAPTAEEVASWEIKEVTPGTAVVVSDGDY